MKNEIKASKLIKFLNTKAQPGKEMVCKKGSKVERHEAIVTKVESAAEDGTVMCTISTQGVDRMGDVVVSKGVDTSEFAKIPSVYINHNYSQLPVATCEELIHQDGAIMAKVKFVLAVPAIKNIFELVKAGALKGISIGFDATQACYKGTKEFEDGIKELALDAVAASKCDRIIKSWKMYEFSFVSIPANADCMTKSLVDAKIEVDPELAKYLGTDDKAKDEKPEEAEEEEAEEPEEDGKKPEDMAKEKWEAFASYGRAHEKGFTAKDADAKELAAGTKVEMEHTKDPMIAERIALDHLADHPDYYTRLAVMEGESAEEQKPKSYVKVLKAPAKSHVKVLRTPEDTAEYIRLRVQARLEGRVSV